MAKDRKGRAGCGCLLFVLVFCMVLAGALVHPFSLRLLSGRLNYQDRIMPADVIFVPRFEEDKNGEVYTEAFRQYWEGNGGSIWIEDDRVFGFTMKDIVTRMAQERGIKAGIIRSIELKGDEFAKASQVRELFVRQGVRKVVIVAPVYASRRFHSVYGTEEPGADERSTVFLVKSVAVPYFQADKWWSQETSRALVMQELYQYGERSLSRLFGRFKSGSRGDTKKE